MHRLISSLATPTSAHPAARTAARHTGMATRRSALTASLAGLALVLAPSAAGAQSWPTRPITFVVAYAAGGAADSLARGVAEELGKRLGQPIVIANAPGASGAIAAKKVLGATPDGYTLLFGTTSEIVVTPIANPALAGYASSEFTPIAKVGITPMTLVARNGLEARTVDELVAAARRSPGAITLGTTGTQTLQAFAAIAFARAAGAEFNIVAYKGGAPLAADLIGGQIDLGITTLPGAMGNVRSGKLRMMGVLSDRRAPAAPDFPTVNESKAIQGVNIDIWAGLVGPPKLPSTIVEKLNRTVRELLEDKAFSERRAKLGDMPVPPEPASAFGAFLNAEARRYESLASGVKRN